jgi:hypothetical protein
MAQEVAEPPSEQEQAAKRDQVCIHDPRERRFREAKIRADRRECDADDRHVEDDHQVTETEDQKCEPEPVVDAPGAHLDGPNLHFGVCPGTHRSSPAAAVKPWQRSRAHSFDPQEGEPMIRVGTKRAIVYRRAPD